MSVAPRPVTVLSGDVSTVGQVRRCAREVAEGLGFDPRTVGRVALVATELTGNLWKHAGGEGWCQLEPVTLGGTAYVRMVCADRGPGIEDPAAALRDGYSTRGTPGTGLGAARRQSQLFDLFTRRGGGTVVTAVVGPPTPMPKGSFEHGGVSLSFPGEPVCGDAWATEEQGRRLWLLVADGLGHGRGAHEAAELAAATFHRLPGRRPGERLEAIHDRLRVSRGAAVAVAEIDISGGVLRYAGIGNVGAVLLGPQERQALVSMNGTAGHHARTIRELDYPCPQGGMLVMHSDGIVSRWGLDQRPGLGERHPSTVAAVLVRDFGRGRDDATALVARWRA
jgi:anti-sigma regulatory factor (Ser/Thr protein kinase)